MSPVRVEIGGQMVDVTTIKDAEPFARLEIAIAAEAAAWQARVDAKGFLAQDVDAGRLIELAMPGVVTAEAWDQSTAPERKRLLKAILDANPRITSALGEG
jgi:hypothetical protein